MSIDVQNQDRIAMSQRERDLLKVMGPAVQTGLYWLRLENACGSCERYQRPPVQDSARAARRVNGTVSDAQSLVGSTLG